MVAGSIALAPPLNRFGEALSSMEYFPLLALSSCTSDARPVVVPGEDWRRAAARSWRTTKLPLPPGSGRYQRSARCRALLAARLPRKRMMGRPSLAALSVSGRLSILILIVSAGDSPLSAVAEASTTPVSGETLVIRPRTTARDSLNIDDGGVLAAMTARAGRAQSSAKSVTAARRVRMEFIVSGPLSVVH